MQINTTISKNIDSNDKIVSHVDWFFFLKKTSKMVKYNMSNMVKYNMVVTMDIRRKNTFFVLQGMSL